MSTDHPSQNDDDGALYRLVDVLAQSIFQHRRSLLALGLILTALLAAVAVEQLKVEAGFRKMLPLQHEYVQTFLDYEAKFGGANKIIVALKARDGDMFDAEFFAALKQLHEEIFFLPGVTRASVGSLYSANTMYIEIIEGGFRGATIIPSTFSGSAADLEQVKTNLLKSRWVGRLAANDLSGALVVATLLETDPETGQKTDLRAVGDALEDLRQRHEGADHSLHIIGFAKMVDDIGDGAAAVLGFFAIAVVITALLLRAYTGSSAITGLVLVIAAVPVVWLLGLMPLVGLGLDPMSILVPFLIFAIGVSHAVQMTNAWCLHSRSGALPLAAARGAFRELFVPGASALLANAIGFLVISFVDIAIVRELALTATLGVTLMIASNKILLPVLLSYIQPSPAMLAVRDDAQLDRVWTGLSALATRRQARWVVPLALLVLAFGVWQGGQRHVGDVGHGIPELRPAARYNLDIGTISASYAIGVDVLQLFLEGKEDGQCVSFAATDRSDRLEFFMRQSEGVNSVLGVGTGIRQATVAQSEGDLAWATIPPSQPQRAQGYHAGNRSFFDSQCRSLNVEVFPTDHQAGTVAHLIAEAKRFAAATDSDDLKLRLAGGNVGIIAATNEVVHAADPLVNLALFAAVTVLCLLTFRSIAITICIVLPLAIVTTLCMAVMAWLDIGLKVNTLPVVALGVGVGVDYGIYLFEVIRHQRSRHGQHLQQAFLSALRARGAASLFTAVTMTLSVATWLFSPLKFQADMGLLLAFMFIVNVLGAILVAPALAALLLRDEPATAGAGG